MIGIKSSFIVYLILLVLWTVLPSQVSAQTMPLFPVLKDESAAEATCRAGYIDAAGNLIVGFKLYYTSEFSEGLAAVSFQRRGTWAYVDTKGEVVIAGPFDEAYPFKEGLAVVRKNGEIFVINNLGSIAFSNPYVTGSFSEGLILAHRGGKWGFIDQSGKVGISFRFSAANQFHEGLASVVVKGKIGYIDKFGNWIIKPSFDTMEHAADWVRLPNFSEGLGVYRHAERYGYIDKKGQVVIAAMFERAMPFSEGLAAVSRDGKWGYIDKAGKFVIEPKFDRGESFSEKLARVFVGQKWGYSDSDGVMVVKPEYDSAASFKFGIAEVTIYDDKKGRTRRGYINRNGGFIYSWIQ